MRNILTTTLLALAGTLVLTNGAHAQTVTTATQDIILGFEATGGTGAAQNLEVDLGPASAFLNATTPFTLTSTQIGNISADLVATYGAAWFSRADLEWSIFGSTGSTTYDGFNSATTFVTNPEATPGVQSNPWPRGSSSANSLASNDIQSVVSSLNGATATANSTHAALIASSDGGSYSSHVDENGSTVSFKEYGPTVQGNFANGTANSILDLYAVQRAGAGTGATVGSPSQFEGTVKLDNSGDVTFSPVPEPASATALVLGAVVLGLRRRRTALNS